MPISFFQGRFPETYASLRILAVCFKLSLDQPCRKAVKEGRENTSDDFCPLLLMLLGPLFLVQLTREVDFLLVFLRLVLSSLLCRASKQLSLGSWQGQKRKGEGRGEEKRGTFRLCSLGCKGPGVIPK